MPRFEPPIALVDTGPTVKAVDRSGDIYADADLDTLFDMPKPKAKCPDAMADTIDKFLYEEFELSPDPRDYYFENYKLARAVIEAWVAKDIDLDNPE